MLSFPEFPVIETDVGVKTRGRSIYFCTPNNFTGILDITSLADFRHILYCHRMFVGNMLFEVFLAHITPCIDPIAPSHCAGKGCLLMDISHVFAIVGSILEGPLLDLLKQGEGQKSFSSVSITALSRADKNLACFLLLLIWACFLDVF